MCNFKIFTIFLIFQKVKILFNKFSKKIPKEDLLPFNEAKNNSNYAFYQNL
jgi:hypothetical protein